MIPRCLNVTADDLGTLCSVPKVRVLFTLPMKTEHSVPKRRHMKFSSRGITKTREHNIHNKAKVGNQETELFE